jgi:hypothetical protein
MLGSGKRNFELEGLWHTGDTPGGHGISSRAVIDLREE